MLAFAVDPGDRKIWVRKEINERLETEEIPREALRLAKETNTRVIAVEVNGGDNWIKNAFINEASKQNAGVEFIWITAPNTATGDYGSGKDGRKRNDAAGTVPWYRNKEIFHEEGLKNGSLEQQQLAFPRNAKWDSLDCLGHLARVLEKMEIYFEPSLETTEEFFEEDESWGDITSILNGLSTRSAKVVHGNPQDYAELHTCL